MSVSPLPPCPQDHWYYLSRFHIYVLMYDICLSLSVLLQSVKQALDSSTSLELTQMHSFLQLSNIPLCMCTTTSLSIHPGCVHVLAIINSAAMNTEVQVSFSILVSSGYMPTSGFSGLYDKFYSQFFKESPYINNKNTFSPKQHLLLFTTCGRR